MTGIEFVTRSALTRDIHLSTVQWTHILERHPEMEGQHKKFQQTLQEPDAVPYDPAEENHQYVRHFRKTPVTEKFLLLVVRHMNGDGFLITAFFVSQVRTQGKEVVYGGETILDQLR